MKRILPHFLILIAASIACNLTGSSPQSVTVTEPPSITDLPLSTATAGILPESTTADVVPSTAPTALALPAAKPRLHPGDSVTLDQIHMFSLTRGWGLSGADVLVTSDGAQTWREVSPPETSPAGSSPKALGAYLDENTAWIIFSVDDQIPVEAVIWHTTDAGATWTPSTPLHHEAYGDVVWVEFSVLDAEHIWLMVRGVYAGAGTHYAAQFFRTEDGGLTWNPIPGDVGIDYTGLVYADPANGLLAWQTAGNYAPYPPEYALTSDGGLAWDVRQLPPPPDAPDIFDTSPYCEPFQPRMLSAQSIRMLVGCFDYSDPPRVSSSYLYSSVDGGSTWTITRLPEDVPAWSSTLFFFDNENGLLLGRDIYRTANGGGQWDHVKSVNWDGQFTFVDPLVGWAVAAADDQIALVKTSNGGDTWSIIEPVIAP